MSIFTTTFGNSAVSPSNVAFAAYSFSTNLQLYWPSFSYGNTTVAARFMNLTATASNLNVIMPDATLVSVGYDVIIYNAGSNTLNVVTFNGSAIVTIAPGQTFYILVDGNSTQDGTWQTVQFGVGTGSAVASALAGAGLMAISNLLNLNLNATTISISTTLATSARAILQVWTGGSGTITLPAAATAGNGFFFPFANDGSGICTIMPAGSDQIDGGSSSAFNATQSAFIVCSGTAWYTVGKGQQTNFAITVNNLNVAGSSNVTLTSAQAQSVIQEYTGTLTGNIQVIVPNTPQIYFIFNNTSGNFTLTVTTSGGSGTTIAQGTNSIVYCDGTNVNPGFTSSFGGAISISAGSAGSPNFNIVGSASTGIYSPAANQLAITAGGYEVMSFASVTPSVNYIAALAAVSGGAPSLTASGPMGVPVNLTITGQNGGQVYIPNASVSAGIINNTVIGNITPAAISGTVIVATSRFSGNLVGNVTGNLTGNVTGAASSNLLSSNNLSDLTSASTARTNLGLGSTITGTGNTVLATSPSFSGTVTMAAMSVVGNATLNGGTTTIANLTVSSSGSLPSSMTAVTQSALDNSTKLATTAYTDAAVAAGGSGVAKAWARFFWNGSSIAIAKSFNITSITRSSAGVYVVTMTNAVTDTNYAVLTTNTIASTVGFINAVTPSSSSQFTISFDTTGGSAVDPSYIAFAVYD